MDPNCYWDVMDQELIDLWEMVDDDCFSSMVEEMFGNDNGLDITTGSNVSIF